MEVPVCWAMWGRTRAVCGVPGPLMAQKFGKRCGPLEGGGCWKLLWPFGDSRGRGILGNSTFQPAGGLPDRQLPWHMAGMGLMPRPGELLFWELFSALAPDLGASLRHVLPLPQHGDLRWPFCRFRLVQGLQPVGAVSIT